jgi:hypothetical protein
VDAKHRIVQLLGIAALIISCLIVLLVLRVMVLGRIATIWSATDLILDFAFAAYLLSVGIRSIHWSRGQGPATSARIKWGRVFLGYLMIYIEVKDHFHPAPNLLRPSNQTQAAAMNATAIALMLLGAWLIVSGVISKFKGQVHGNESSKAVP